MFKRKYYLYLGEMEQRVLIRSLVRMKNRLIRERRCTDCVDELLLKICSNVSFLSAYSRSTARSLTVV